MNNEPVAWITKKGTREMNPHETGTDNPIDFPKYTLTCGCRSEHYGFFCEWDTETRECEPAVAYGCLCAKHYAQYNARPTEEEQEK